MCTKKKVKKFNRFFTLKKGFKIGPSGILDPSPLAYWPWDETSNPSMPYFETFFLSYILLQIWTIMTFINMTILDGNIEWKNGQNI
jgi:hypothetical protein